MGIDNKIGISRVVPCFSGRSRGIPIVYAELIFYVFLPFFFFFFFLIAVSIFCLLWAHFMYSLSNVI